MGLSTESVECNVERCPFWREWTPFGMCSVSCNGGIRNRTRMCANGSPGVIGCEGLSREVMTCNDEVGFVCLTPFFFLNICEEPAKQR